MNNTLDINDRIDLVVEDAKLEILRLRCAFESIAADLDDADHSNIDALNAMLDGLDAAWDLVEEVEDREFIF